MARQENIRLLFEQVRLGNVMVEAAGRVVKVLVGEKVDVDAALAFIYLDDLEGVETCEGGKHWEDAPNQTGLSGLGYQKVEDTTHSLRK